MKNINLNFFLKCLHEKFLSLFLSGGGLSSSQHQQLQKLLKQAEPSVVNKQIEHYE